MDGLKRIVGRVSRKISDKVTFSRYITSLKWAIHIKRTYKNFFQIHIFIFFLHPVSDIRNRYNKKSNIQNNNHVKYFLYKDAC